jgi:hypothetical protein
MWEGNSKYIPQKYWWDLDWIPWAEDRLQWWFVLNAFINLRD